MLQPLLVITLLLGSGMCLWMAYQSWRQRVTFSARLYTAIFLAIAVYAIGYSLELTRTDLVSMLLCVRLEYLGIVNIAPLWLALTLYYANRLDWMQPRRLVLLWIIPVIVLIAVFTNDSFHLLYLSSTIASAETFPTLEFSRGPVYWLHIIYSFGSFFLSAILLARQLFSPHVLFRKQVTALLVSSVVTILITTIYWARIFPLPDLDIIPFAMIISGGIFGWGVLKTRLIDLTPIARDVLFENLTDGVIVLDDQDEVVDFNPAAAQILGLTDKTVGLPLTQNLAEELKPVFTNIPSFHPFREFFLTAGERTIEISQSNMIRGKRRLAGGRLIVLHDITYQKQAQNQLEDLNAELSQQYDQLKAAESMLRSSQENYQQLLENASFPLIITSLEDSTVIYCNHLAAELLETPSSQVIGLSAASFYVEPDQRINFLNGLFTKGKIRDFEVQLKTGKGKTFWGLVSAHKITFGGQEAFTVALQDISPRKIAEEELRQSENRYSQLTSHMTDVIWSMDPSGLFNYLTPSVEELLGYTPTELVGNSLTSILSLQDYASVQQRIINQAQRAALGEPIETPGQFEFELIRKDGSTIWTEISIDVLFDEQGHYSGLMGVTRDMTERRKIEEKVRQQQKALAVLEERERMGRELHDSLGQVLSFVNTQTQAVQDMISQGNYSAAAGYLTRLSIVAQEANTDIREFIMEMKSAPAEMGFFGAIRSFLDKFSHMSGIQTMLSLPPGDIESFLSPPVQIQLLRIIQESLTNARKYSEARSVHVIFSNTSSHVQIVIADDGIGFDPAQIKERSGIHFGLEIMRERAEEAGGNLEVRSAPGQGTQIVAVFPVMERSHIELKSVKFILADDHPLILEGVKNLLTSHGVSIIGTANTGKEALLLTRNLKPDVVLMDMNMPEMSGAEATRLIKDEMPEVKVVMLTLSTSTEDIALAISSGANGYLLKNQEPEEFLTLLGRIINGESVMAPEITERILYSVAKPHFRTSPEEAETILLAAGLTNQQIFILRSVVIGKEYKEIASELHISPHTVKYHFNQVLDHLRLTSRSEALAYSIQIGLVKGRRREDQFI